MSAAPSAYAALILPDASGLDAAPYLNAARRVMQHQSAKTNPTPCPRDTADTVCDQRLCLRVQAEEFSDYGPRILFTITPRDGQVFDLPKASRVLSASLQAALAFSDADIVEWGAPDRLFDTADFREALANGRLHDLAATAQSRLAERTFDTLFRDPQEGLPLAPPSALTTRLLARCEALRGKEPGNLRLGAANWAMTGTVACIAPPIGASMTVLGLVRGLDFRRVTQALTLTAVFVLLQNQGAISQVAQSVLR